MSGFVGEGRQCQPDFALFDVFPRFGAKILAAFEKCRQGRRAIWKTFVVKTAEIIRDDLLESLFPVVIAVVAERADASAWRRSMQSDVHF